MLVFGIVMTMVVGILSPAAKLFLRMERLQRAQAIMDNIIWELSAMAEDASGYVKIYPSGTEDAANVEGVSGTEKGSMLEFVGREGYATLISAEGCEKSTKIIVGGNELAQSESIDPGRLFTRYYYVPSTENSNAYKYQCKNDAGEPVARAITTAFGKGYYMGNYLEIDFSFPPGIDVEDEVTSLYANVRLYGTDSDGKKDDGQLIVQEENVVLNFRYALVRKDGITATDSLTPETP